MCIQCISSKNLQFLSLEISLILQDSGRLLTDLTRKQFYGLNDKTDRQTNCLGPRHQEAYYMVCRTGRGNLINMDKYVYSIFSFSPLLKSNPLLTGKENGVYVQFIPVVSCFL